VVEVPSGRQARKVQRITYEAEARRLVTELRTHARIEDAQAEAAVAGAQIRELNSLTGQAMAGHTFLTTRVHQLAGEDILLADELRAFKEIARIASAEIIIGLVNKYQRM